MSSCSVSLGFCRIVTSDAWDPSGRSASVKDDARTSISADSSSLVLAPGPGTMVTSEGGPEGCGMSSCGILGWAETDSDRISELSLGSLSCVACSATSRRSCTNLCPVSATCDRDCCEILLGVGACRPASSERCLSSRSASSRISCATNSPYPATACFAASTSASCAESSSVGPALFATASEISVLAATATAAFTSCEAEWSSSDTATEEALPEAGRTSSLTSTGSCTNMLPSVATWLASTSGSLGPMVKEDARTLISSNSSSLVLGSRPGTIVISDGAFEGFANR
mmetsp:Transcript_3612/g.8551  ORF Transcript_3612/g.8551 Transcript_3612/m.8551 type:complete len:286 (-) Transcript_3612:304-1161(-)